MVDDAKAGDVVCAVFPHGAASTVLGEYGNSHPQRSHLASALGGVGWKLHVDARDPWGHRALTLPANPPPIEWSSLSVFPSLQVLDLGARQINDDELAQISQSTDLRVLLARCANITNEGLAAVAALKNLRDSLARAVLN